jgi:hypothetical protein
MKNPFQKKRLSLWDRVKFFFKQIRWRFQGIRLAAKLQDSNSEARDEAIAAIKRVVFESDIPPDCVSAQIVRGGTSILIKHNDAWEAFVHNSYGEAAQKAIEWLWLQGDEISTSKTTRLNRVQRRFFKKVRRLKAKERARLN